MYCRKCGKEIPAGAAFCQECGTPANDKPAVRHSGLVCPKCGSTNVEVQLHQEETGSMTKTKTKYKIKEKGHGIIWKIFFFPFYLISIPIKILFDILVWVFFWPIKLVKALNRKKKYIGDSSSVSKTTNSVAYRSVCLCKDCGHNWQKK